MKKKITALLASFSLLFFSLQLSGQDGSVVRGIVIDENQERIPAATIVLKGNTSVGTTANLEGEFTLRIPSGDQTLVVSFVGFETQEINVSGSEEITVTLEESSVQLEELIVVGLRINGCHCRIDQLCKGNNHRQHNDDSRSYSFQPRKYCYLLLHGQHHPRKV